MVLARPCAYVLWLCSVGSLVGLLAVGLGCSFACTWDPLSPTGLLHPALI